MTRFRDRWDVGLFAIYCAFIAFLVFGVYMGWWHVRT